MTFDEHRRFQEMLGAYLLGELDEGEREAIQAHLDGCEACQAEIRELGIVTASLANAAPEHIEEAPEPPEDLEDRVLAPILLETRRARRRKGFRRATLVAAAAALLVAVGLFVLSPDSLFGPTLEPVAFSGMPPGIEAEADLISHTWGTETRLVASGLDDGQTYRVSLLNEDGARAPSGTFIGIGEKPVECNLNAALLREDAVGLEVRTASNDELILRADLSEPQSASLSPSLADLIS